VTPKIYGYHKKGKQLGKPLYKTDILRYKKDRTKLRSKTYTGIAKAIAEQWGNFLTQTKHKN